MQNISAFVELKTLSNVKETPGRQKGAGANEWCGFTEIDQGTGSGISIFTKDPNSVKLYIQTEGIERISGLKKIKEYMQKKGKKKC